MKSIKKDLKSRHLILFDDSCPFCQRAASHIISKDKKSLFIFSPLTGKTSQKILKEKQEHFLEKNSLVLIEDFETNPRIFIRSKAVFRIYSSIGGLYRLLGILAFCPFLFDPIYRLIARHRHGLAKKKDFTFPKDRFIH